MNEKENKIKYDAYELVKKTKNFSHAYIVETKDTEQGINFSKFLSKNLICNDFKSKTHDEKICKVCSKIENESYLDVEYIKPEGLFMKIEQIRNLKSNMNKMSLLNNNRVYVVINAEKMGDRNFNAMLKFIEEPAENTFCVLLTNNYYSIIPTIRSRCQKIRLMLNKNTETEAADLDLAKQIIELIEQNKNKALLTIHTYFENKTKEEILTLINQMTIVYLNEKETYSDWILKINKILKYKKEILYNINTNLFLDKMVIELGGL